MATEVSVHGVTKTNERILSVFSMHIFNVTDLVTSLQNQYHTLEIIMTINHLNLTMITSHLTQKTTMIISHMTIPAMVTSHLIQVTMVIHHVIATTIRTHRQLTTTIATVEGRQGMVTVMTIKIIITMTTPIRRYLRYVP